MFADDTVSFSSIFSLTTFASAKEEKTEPIKNKSVIYFKVPTTGKMLGAMVKYYIVTFGKPVVVSFSAGNPKVKSAKNIKMMYGTMIWIS